MLKGLFSIFSKEKEDFFLELDPAKEEKVTHVETGDQAKPIEAKTPKAKPKAIEKASAVAAVVEEDPEKTSKGKKSKKTSVKKAAKKEAEKSKTPPSVVNNGLVAKKEEPKEVEFATKYFIVPTGSRRRPGPSLNAFKNMARQVKTPRS